MHDTGTGPSGTGRSSGFELMFVFVLPALMVVGSLAAMAHTGYWWLMGVTFAGALGATGLLALTIFHFADDGLEPGADGSYKQTTDRPARPQRPVTRPRRHRLVLHH